MGMARYTVSVTSTQALSTVNSALAWLRRYDSWQPTYNPSTRRMEQRIVTAWRRLPVTGDWQRTYEGDEPGMQACSVLFLHAAPAWRVLLQQAWHGSTRCLITS